MASLTLGKVSIRPRGGYIAGTNYAVLDAVSNLGGSFLCLNPTSSIEPGVTSGWESYWMVLSEGIERIEISSPETGKASLTIFLSDGTTSTAVFDTTAIGEGAITRNELAADVKVLAFTNQTVNTSAWLPDSTYADYEYRAAISLSGVTTNFVSSVVFSPDDADSGVYARVSNSFNGGVYIYANNAPSETITIPTILCIPIA